MYPTGAGSKRLLEAGNLHAAARDGDIPKQELLRTMARGMGEGVFASWRRRVFPAAKEAV